MTNKTATYGAKQELILKNLTNIALKLPMLEDRVLTFMRKEIGTEPSARPAKSGSSLVKPNNIFEAIELKSDEIRYAIDQLSLVIGMLENSINPTSTVNSNDR